YKAASRFAKTSRRSHYREGAVHERKRPAPSRSLGSSRDRRADRVHRMDGARKAAASAASGRPRRQEPGRCRSGAVVITHPEKMLFPQDGITKGELAAYYEAVAPVMLPHLRGRPLTMERYPSGIARQGFWQKDVSKGFPNWLERVEVPKKDGVVHHPVITD